MYKKRQRGGNFKGKKYQRSKPKKQDGGGRFVDFAKVMEGVGHNVKKSAKAVHRRMYVQKGGGMRRPGPPKRRRNTIPNANYVMYHR
jgi:hypothetical protein